MTERGYDLGALIAGLLFIGIGLAFLLDRLGVWRVQATSVWAIALIGVGLAVLLSGFGRYSRDGSQ